MSIPTYAPYAPILQPWIDPWEEVRANVLQPQRRELVRYGFTPWGAFRLHKIGIDVASHQDLRPVRLIPDGRSGVLYGRGVSGGDIAPHDMPPPPLHHQMKADDVHDVEAELFDSKVLCLAEKNLDASAVSAWRLCRYHPKAFWFLRVNSFCELCLLKYTKINRSLLHPEKC